MENYKEKTEFLSDKLTQNGLYYSGKEFNTSDGSAYGSSDLKVLICRLSTYRDTSQSFTHPLLYKLISSVEGAFADMAYLPPPNDLEVLKKNNIPLLLPTKTKAEPVSFDVIALSNSLVQELLNIETLLSESGIETDHSKRIVDESQPLVVLGGSNSANSHYLMHENSPVDIVFTNDDPDDIIEFFLRIRKYKVSGMKKAEIIEKLFGEFPAVVPRKGANGIKNKISSDYSSKIQPSGVPLLFKEDPHSTNLVISRGCPWFCSFCNESFRTKPYSELSAEEIFQSALAIKKENGSSEVSLFSFNFNAHSKIEEVLGELHRQFRIVSLKSQRFDILSLRHEFLKILQFAGKTSITCGLEGISDRMRSYLSKDLSHVELENSLTVLLNSPVRTLKIFLIATGLENDEDINELQTLVKFIKNSGQNRPRPPRVVFSLTPLVRFPGTPAGFKKAYPVQEIQILSDKISKVVTAEGFEFRLANPVYEYWVSQILLRNNSVEFYNIVQKTIKDTGFIYYTAIQKGFYERLFNNLRELNIDPDELLNNGLDLSHYNSNLSTDFILRSNEKMHSFADTETCYSIKTDKATCKACGACETPEERKFAMSYIRGRGLSVDRLKEIQLKYSQGVEVSIPIILNEKCINLTNPYLGAVFTSAIIRSIPESENFIKKFIRFNNRDRFQTESLLGKEEIIFLCKYDHEEFFKEHIKTEEFINKFKVFAQGFGEICETDAIRNKLIISIQAETKIDTSFISKFHIKSTVVKVKDGIYEAQVAKEGLKKKQFSSVIINIPECIIEVSYGDKFDLNGFIKIVCDSYKIKNNALKIIII